MSNKTGYVGTHVRGASPPTLPAVRTASQPDRRRYRATPPAGRPLAMSVFAEFSLPVTAFPPGGRLAGTDLAAELERVVHGGSRTHYVWLVGDDRQAVLAAMDRDRSADVETLDSLANRTLVRIHTDSEDETLFSLLEAESASFVGATGTAAGWTVTARFPEEDALAGFFEACRERGVSAELNHVDRVGFAGPEDFDLTPAQREAVVAAAARGYFEVPRRTTIGDLADELGVSNQAVSERLRRGLGKHLAATLGEPVSGDSGDDAGRSSADDPGRGPVD